MNILGKTALVTGGAGGIGFELCKLMAEDGYNLVIVDMNKAGMNRVAEEIEGRFGIRVTTIVKDLSNPDAAREICDELDARGLEIDLLVNNAGYGLQGAFIEISLADQLKMIQVNVSAVVALTGFLLPRMLRRGGGAILNVASIAAFQAGPYMAAYFASKAFVLSFTEALAKELENTPITVTSLCPPPTDTGFAERANAEKSVAFRRGVMMNCQDVAREAWKGLKAKRVVVLPGLGNKFVIMASRFLPRSTPVAVAGVLNKGRRSGKPPQSRVSQVMEWLPIKS